MSAKNLQDSKEKKKEHDDINKFLDQAVAKNNRIMKRKAKRAMNREASTSSNSTTPGTTSSTAPASGNVLDKTPLINAQQEKSAEDLTKIADQMWKQVKEIVKSDESFVKLPDKKKLDYFRDKLKHGEFMTEFPIVSRYMICMGQYSSKAFNRFLEKIRITVHPPPDKREKGYMEDQWVRRQADYVRYLWEAYQKGKHYDNAEAKWVWESSYKNLKGEFDDFRNKYKEIEKNSKEEKEILKVSNLKDLLARLVSGEQTLSDDDNKRLIGMLKDQQYKRRFKNTMEELRNKAKVLPATCTGYGAGPEDKTDPNAPKIRMIEHVAPEDMSKIPQHLHLDEKTAKELPGYLDSIQEETYE